MVSMGNAKQTAAFRQRHKLPFVCLADPGREAYQAFGLGRGTIGQIAGPRVWASGIKALLRGGGGLPSGDVRQMPGAFVIDRTGIVQFTHYPINSADYPPHEAMIERFATAAQ